MYSVLQMGTGGEPQNKKSHKMESATARPRIDILQQPFRRSSYRPNRTIINRL